MTAPPLVVARARYGGPEADRLEARTRLHVVDGPVRPALMAGDLPAWAMWSFGERVDAALLDRVPTLRAVAVLGSGTDGIDHDLLAERGVALVTARGANAEAVADHAFALMLAVRHRILEGDRIVRSGGWSAPGFAHPVGEDLHGSTLGIVGLGAIGRAVARRAAGFCMPVLYHARRRVPGDVEDALGATRVELAELLERSDVVSLHCPLTSETRGLLDDEAFRRMRPGAILVNTARGAVCDQSALVRALVEGRLLGAGLDVLDGEPAVPPALADHPRVVLTPHVADATHGAETALARRNVDDLLALLPG